ncbi:MAG: DUF1194 domain-containing protein [Pseudomonadota bacterium]
MAVLAAAVRLAHATRTVSAQDRGVPVDLELIVAVDVSGSIDEEEARLQRDGYLAAFTDEEVIGAITGGMLGKISVTYIEWAGAHYATTIVDWRLIDSRASAEAFAEEVARAPLQTALWTSISRAIDYVLPKFDGNGFEGTRRVIDISGDGPNNQGGLVTLFRDKAIAAGVTINGLPIVNDKPSPWGWPPLPDLDLYYANCVIGGSGAFYVVANTFKDFARAVRQKLLLEIAGRTPSNAGPERLYRAAAQGGNRTAPPCDIGERRVQWLLDEQ